MSDTDQDDTPSGALEIELPSDAAPSGGLSIETGEGLSDLSKRLAVHETLFRVLTSDMSFQEFCKEILGVLTQCVPCEASSLLEVNYRDQTIFFRAATGHNSEQVTKFTVPMGKGIVGHVVESQQPLIVADAEENQIHLKAIAASLGFEVRGLVAYPLIIRGRVFGVLEFINRIGEPSFTPTDLEFLESITRVCAQAIEIRLMIAWAKNQQSKKRAA